MLVPYMHVQVIKAARKLNAKKAAAAAAKARRAADAEMRNARAAEEKAANLSSMRSAREAQMAEQARLLEERRNRAAEKKATDRARALVAARAAQEARAANAYADVYRSGSERPRQPPLSSRARTATSFETEVRAMLHDQSRMLEQALFRMDVLEARIAKFSRPPTSMSTRSDGG